MSILLGFPDHTTQVLIWSSTRSSDSYPLRALFSKKDSIPHTQGQHIFPDSESTDPFCSSLKDRADNKFRTGSSTVRTKQPPSSSASGELCERSFGTLHPCKLPGFAGLRVESAGVCDSSRRQPSRGTCSTACGCARLSATS